MHVAVGRDRDVNGRPVGVNATERRGITRRSVLAAAGLAAATSMAGCVDRAAARVTKTTSSPAAAMSGAMLGFRQGAETAAAYDLGDRAIEHVPAEVRATAGSFSGSVTLEGWLTDGDIVSPAKNYNSTRSNRRKNAVVPFDDANEGGDDSEDSEDVVSDGDSVSEAFAADIDALYTYLDDEPTLGERLCVCLPDARLPRGGPAVADEVTPRRVIQYLTGEAARCGVDDEGALWCWGSGDSSRQQTTFSTAVDGRRRVAAFATREGVCVAGVAPDADGASEELAIVPTAVDGSVRFTVEEADMDGWGEEVVVGDVAVSSTIVCPIVVQPNDAPVPFYALLSLTRCRHGDEYLYVCGWLIDDAAVQYDSCTLLAASEVCPVVGITPEEARDTDAARRVLQGVAAQARRREQGAVVYDGPIDDGALRHLPDALAEGDGLDGVVSLVTSSNRSARTGRNPQTGKEIQIPAKNVPTGSEEGTEMRCLLTALDCPIVHLVEADGIERSAKIDGLSSLTSVGQRS